ncbi:MAG: hypothetical protein NZM12_09720 [Steroidobacteraceae bacterium]|nr:hypothetical protein [Steroidobacteraceae bacterium]
MSVVNTGTNIGGEAVIGLTGSMGVSWNDFKSEGRVVLVISV